MSWPDPLLGPTWTVVAQHVPFVVGAASLVSWLAFTDLRRHAGSGVRVRARARAVSLDGMSKDQTYPPRHTT
jgi:hypothetical protein